MELLYLIINFLLVMSIGNYFKVENVFTLLLLITIINIITSYVLEKNKDKILILFILPLVILITLIHLPILEEFWNCLTSSNKNIKIFSYALFNTGIYIFVYNMVKKNNITILENFMKK